MVVVRRQSLFFVMPGMSGVYAPKAQGLVSEGQRPGKLAQNNSRPERAELGRVLPFQGEKMLVGWPGSQAGGLG